MTKIIIPKNEKRTIIGGTLSNEIKYITINDPNLDTTSVVVTVNIGSLAEDKELKFQGLAHFLEHMLFLGSKKYPGIDTYNNLISSNGGTSNAYTENTRTTYHFSIYNNVLDNALDIFSRFFIDPLFDIDSVNKELNAVHSEHSKNINHDGWRGDYFKDIISKKGSIINRFKTGNLSSLKKDGIREAMIEFYNKYYIPSNTSVIIASSLDNNQLYEKINKTFGNIQAKPKINITIEKPLYNPGIESFYLKSVDDIYKISYLWEINKTDYYKNTHLPWILSGVILSGNENSFKKFMIKKGLIKGLGCQVFQHGVIMVDIYLTNFDNLEVVNNYFVYYIKSLRNHNWYNIINYNKKKDELFFNYSSKDDSLDLSLFFSTNIFEYPIEKVWYSSSIVENIDTEGMIDLIDKLSFNDVKIIITSKNKPEKKYIRYISNHNEPYYTLNYSKIDLNFNNDLIPFEYEIISDNVYLNTSPKLIKNLDDNINPKLVSRYGSKVWFGNISKFNETIILSNLIFTNLQFIFDIKNYIEIQLFLSYVQTKINEYFNLPFEIGFVASLKFNESSSQIILEISGYNHNYNLFFNEVIDYIINFKYDELDYDILNTKIKNTMENYKNMNTNTPYIYAGYIEDLNINSYSYTREDAIEYLKSLNITNFITRIREFKNLIFYQSKFTSFIYGNVEYNTLFNSDNNLKLDFPSIEKPRNILKLRTNVSVIHPNPKETNNFIKYSYFIGNFNPLNNLYLLILSVGFSNTFYTELRSKQQFGYIVYAGVSGYQRKYYFQQVIQSDKSIDEIKSAINKFNNEYLNMIEEKDFNKFVESAKNILNEKETKMSDLINRFYGEILDNSFIFNRKQLLINQLKNVTYEKFKLFYKEKILNGKISITEIAKK